jgi:hypothetical protein
MRPGFPRLITDIRWQKPPRPWEITGGGRALRIGKRTVALAEVSGYTTSESREPNVVGHLAAIGLFMGLGAMFIVPVMMGLVGPKFLVGAVLFIGLGLSAIVEIRGLSAIHLYRLDIELVGGDTLPFVSVAPHEVDALVAALEARK